MRVVIDTCIMIDFATGRDEQLMNAANSILALGCMGKAECFITSNTVTDIYYILHHINHCAELAHEYLDKLLSYVTILPVNSEDCHKALNSKMTDFEDAVLSECALRNKADFIVTDNLKDFKNSAVPAIASSEFVKMIIKKG